MDNLHEDSRNLHWSLREKQVARGAFQKALEEELGSIVREAQARAAKIATPEQLWDLEAYLTRCRREIDSKYDFRYSVLPLVFGILIQEGRMSEEDLDGLGPEKLACIRRCVSAAD